MTPVPGSSAPPDAAELLERAVGYTRRALDHVRPEQLGWPTPCPGWDLDRLLRHMDDSLAAMTEAAGSRRLGLTPAPSPRTTDELLDGIRQRACALVSGWIATSPGAVALGGKDVDRQTLGQVGALEITLHGWDVGHACGCPRPVPPVLAMDLWPVARDHIGEADPPCRVGPALEVPDWASPQQRLLSWTGRRA